MARIKWVIDLRRLIAQRGLMSWLRSFALLLLVLAVMPWGAYSGAIGVQSDVAQEQDFAGAGPDVVVWGGDPRDGMSFAPKPKRCRTAMLPGAPCGPDLALPGSAPGPDLTGVAAADLAAGGVRLAGVTPAGWLDPPRLG